jgi:hypothetical protein
MRSASTNIYIRSQRVASAADGIQKSEPAPDALQAIPDASEGFDGTEKEIFETMEMYVRLV